MGQTFGDLCCEVCGIAGSAVAMHRSGPKGKGQDPHWRCEPCLSTPPDESVLAVTDYFQTANMDERPMTPEEVAWVRSQRARGSD